MTSQFRRLCLAAAGALMLGACTPSIPQPGETETEAATEAAPTAEPVPLDSFELSGLAELGYEVNPGVASENLVQWQSPGCQVQALVAPSVGTGDDAADSVASFDLLGPEFQDLREDGWVQLPLATGGTLRMPVRTGVFELEGAAVPVNIAARAVGEVQTLFVITHTCAEDAPHPTSLADVIQRIVLTGVLNPDA
ncbi:MAG: hypothetical protein Q4G64_03570 [bacterium]|nr:hypothetical protein [bacterium]